MPPHKISHALQSNLNFFISRGVRAADITRPADAKGPTGDDGHAARRWSRRGQGRQTDQFENLTSLAVLPYLRRKLGQHP